MPLPISDRQDGTPNKDLLWQKRAFRERRGTGSGAEYVPWIQVRRHDFNSRGRSHVITNPLTGRQHHLLSDLEKDIYQLLLWAHVFDIREQYPLQLRTDDLEFIAPGSLEIADSLGLRHPMIRADEPRVMTTDFLVTLPNHTHIAIYAKYSSELSQNEGSRAAELIEIANSYWQVRKVDFYKISERDVPKGAIAWCDWFADSLKVIYSEEKRRLFIKALRKTNSSVPMRTRIERTSLDLSWNIATCKTLLAHSVFHHDIVVPTNETPDYSRPWSIEFNDSRIRIPKWHFLSDLINRA